MGGRGVAVPRAWGRKRERSPIPHRSEWITTPNHDKKCSGALSRLFEGSLNPDRSVPHVDKLLPWLIVCAAAKIQNKQKAGRGEESLRGDRHPTGRSHRLQRYPTEPRPNGGVRARARDGGLSHTPAADRPATAFLVRPCRLRRTGASLQTHDRLAGRTDRTERRVLCQMPRLFLSALNEQA